MSKATPWGPAQDVRMIAPGITSYSTAGHGGINLSKDRIAAMPDALRRITPFAGPGWYEEDCDWAIVALAFPDLFTAEYVAAAVRMLAGTHKDGTLHRAAEWLATDEGAKVRGIADAWQAENASLFRMACSGSIPRRYEELAKRLQGPLTPFASPRYLSWVALRRVSDDAEAEALLYSEEQRGTIDLSTIPAERVMTRPAYLSAA